MDKEIYDDAKVLLVNQEFEIIQHILPFNEKDTQGQLKIGSFRRCGDNIVFTTLFLMIFIYLKNRVSWVKNILFL